MSRKYWPRGSGRIAAQRNAMKKCNAPGCPRTRSYLSGYCMKHKLAAYRHGHPHGRALPAKRLRPARDAVIALLAANPEHEGVKAAEKFFHDWIMRATRFERVPGAELMRRLWQSWMADGSRSIEELTKECVVTCATLWLYSLRYRYELPDDARLTYALARGCLRLGSNVGGKDGHLGGPELGDIGTYVRTHLGLLLVNIAYGIKDAEDTKVNARKAMAQSFIVPSEAISRDHDYEKEDVT